jgi:radical SAM superfamily enzyme YgiQ (UPF0313 family)
MSKKRGLLINPDFPVSYWSYKHIMPMINRKAAFPPLGLITFAAYLEEWDLELIDINARPLSERKLHQKIAEADAAFITAMSIQRPSLEWILTGPAHGTGTPVVLGGPFASTYRDHALDPQNSADRILYEGLDLLVWGESRQWIDDIEQFLEEHPQHTTNEPTIFIPQKVVQAVPGTRDHLNDRTIFGQDLKNPLPRWDLLTDIDDYRATSIQTSIGCPFRCDFCDIIEFTGGFSRPKSQEDVTAELQAIYDTGYRGSLFAVDDNFIGSIDGIKKVLAAIIDFQRKHNYPFDIYTQASVDVGSEKNRHIIEDMRRAGYSAVFLGIENPDPEALNGMNKKQNNTVNLQDTVASLQNAGIEVYAGFIFGSDEDTPETADTIIDFVKEAAISTAMTGLLTPLPHTPLWVKLQQDGRLKEAIHAGNNVDDEVQFTHPTMSKDELKGGLQRILQELYHPEEIYRRATDTLRRTTPHIYSNSRLNPGEIKAGILSLWKQGIARLDMDYFRLLRDANRLDREGLRQVDQELHDLDATLGSTDVNPLSRIIGYAQDNLIRNHPGMPTEKIDEYVADLKHAATNDRLVEEEVRTLKANVTEYLEQRRQQFKFPGINLARAITHAVKGLHYQKVTEEIVSNRPTQYSPLFQTPALPHQEQQTPQNSSHL